MTRKIKKLIKDFDISSFNYSGGMGGGDGGVSEDLLTTKGDTHGFSNQNSRVGIGADSTVLTADSTEALGLKWAAAATPDSSVDTDIVVMDYSTTLSDYTSPNSATVSNAVSASSNISIQANSANDNPQVIFDLQTALGVSVGGNFVMRFPLQFTSFTNTYSGQAVGFHIGLSDTATVVGENPSQMMLYYSRAAHGAGLNGEPSVRATTTGTNTTAAGSTTASPYSQTVYVQIRRTSASASIMTLYSDSTYAAPALLETVNISFAVNPTGLRYIFARIFYQNVSNTNTVLIEGFEFWNNMDTATGGADYTWDGSATGWTQITNGGTITFTVGSGALQAVDDNLTTYWESNAAANNWIYVDNVTEKSISQMTIYPKSTTTETQYKIQWSNDLATWTDVRLINVSALTNGSYNYIRFNGVSARYFRIYGNSGTSYVMSINNIRVNESTSIDATHGHLEISATDSALALDGT